jgi:transposase
MFEANWDNQTHLFLSTTTMRAIPPTTVQNIISLLDSKHSTREIATRVGVSQGTVSNIRNQHCPTLSKSSGGRPPKLSENDIRQSVRAITSGKADTAVQVRQMLGNITNTSVSANTVRRGLKNAGLKSVVKTKKPLLLNRHRQARMDFAIAHQSWTSADWSRVIWSDETKIN